ncbi:MAG: very short patch repair endonuclease [Chitinophagaceae bacterium]
MDIWTKEKRSEVMSKIRGKNTKPEKLLRSLLHKKGLRYRIHRKDLPGKPDIIFVKQKVAIFVHGCFWHFHKECNEGRIPSSNSNFWKLKLEKNIAKDERHIEALKLAGWKVMVIWECEIEKNIKDKLDGIILSIKTN